MSTILARQPTFHLYGFKFRLWPIIVAAVLMQGIVWSGLGIAKWVYKNGPESWAGHPAVFLLLAILCMALLGLVGILAMRRLLPQADAHLRWPPDKSYAGLACLIGIGMGLTMLAADFWPDLLSQTPPQTNYKGTPLDLAGFLLGMITTGLAEETIFRGLLVGMLVVLMPGRLRIGSIDLPVAAYVVALLFAAAHWKSFILDPLHQAVAQQTYAFIWGLIYVWLMERSRSLVAPIIAHGMGNFTEVSLLICLGMLWS
jgi:membrane protease YdiL (CAAX protease family)